MQGRRHKVESALKRINQTLAILNKLVQDYPVPEHRLLLATTQMNLANTYTTKGWFDKAELPLKEAQRIYGQLIQDQANSLPEHRQMLGRCLAILGMNYRGQSNTEKAEAAHREEPKDGHRAGQVQIEKAEAAQLQALDIFEKLVKEHRGIPDHAYDGGHCYSELVITANCAGQPDLAIERHSKAIPILEGLLDVNFGAAGNPLLSARIDRSTALASHGDHLQAITEAMAVAKQGGLTSSHLYDMACTYAQASAAADRDAKLSPADRASRKTNYTKRAFEYLHKAIADGWEFPAMLRTDPDMNPLHDLAEFKKTLAELEEKEKESEKRNQD